MAFALVADDICAAIVSLVGLMVALLIPVVLVFCLWYD